MTTEQLARLTVDELIDLEQKHRSHESLTRAIEAKLKEKNAWLTEEEVRECYAHVEGVTVSEAVILMSVVRATQAKLKEKNT